MADVIPRVVWQMSLHLCRCPGSTPILTRPSWVYLVWHSPWHCWCTFTIQAVFLEVEGCKYCTWWKPTGINHTLSGPVAGVIMCRKCCPKSQHNQSIDLTGVHLDTTRLVNANNVVEPHLVGRWTPVPSHLWVVALTNSPACPGTPFLWCCPLQRRTGQTYIFLKWQNTHLLWGCRILSQS